MTPFTPAEIEYLRTQPLGRIATVSAAGEPDVAPVGFRLLDDGRIEIGGLDNPKTIKWRNVLATGRAAFVVDDLVTVEPWAPRGLKIRGAASGATDNGNVIRITASTIWSWGLNADAPKHFVGKIERRDV
jgi:pyridoxamine 5'-phosphate oxidase family protein